MNTPNENNQEPFYNPKDHIEEIVALPEFDSLHEKFQDEPMPFFGDSAALKKSRRIYRFLELAHPYLQSDQDAEAYIEEQQTSTRLRKFLDSMAEKKPDVKPTAVAIPHNTVKTAALKKTIQELEDRISQIRRQLGDNNEK